MIKEKTKTNLKITSISKAIQKVVDDGKTPRSIRQIKDKYELNFPFQVKSVSNQGKLAAGELFLITGFQNIEDIPGKIVDPDAAGATVAKDIKIRIKTITYLLDVDVINFVLA